MEGTCIFWNCTIVFNAALLSFHFLENVRWKATGIFCWREPLSKGNCIKEVIFPVGQDSYQNKNLLRE